MYSRPLNHIYSKSMQLLTLLLTVIMVSYSQKCLNRDGKPVDWYLQLHLPASVDSGYLYFDSLSTQPQFEKVSSSPDSQGQPLFNTLSQISSLPNTDYIAWNDQNPNGSTSSVKAHSKSVLLFEKETNNGIVIVHSMPKYPAIVDHQAQITIPDSQKVYGQHFFCLQVSGATMSQIMSKASTARLYIYASSISSLE
jgi:hypothetical protein